MKGTSGVVCRALGMACAMGLTVSLCTGETVVPPRAGARELPTGPLRGPDVKGVPARPRRIEGGTYYYELAEVHKRYGVYDKAAEMLKMAIEKEPDASKKMRYYESLGEVYRLQGEPKGATDQIKNALEGAKTVEEKCRYNSILGRMYEQAGDIEGAKKAYEFVIANSTRDAEKRNAQLSLFRLYQSAGEMDKVIADLEKKLEQKPEDEDALETLAQIFTSVVREPSRAVSVYERLSRLKPKDTSVLNRLVYLYQMNKEYEKAAEVYQRVIEASPPRNRNYYYQHVSRMYMLAGKKDEAMQWAEKSLSEGSVSPYTYVSIAQLYLQNNLAEKALGLYEKAIAASQRPMEKHQVSLRFADIFAQNNKEEKAEELYKYVLKEATVPFLKSQARSKLVSLYRKQGKTKEIEALSAEEKENATPGE